jgi:hypothetical protein
MSNNNYLVVKDKVQRFAKQLFNSVQIEDDGSLGIPYESTHILIEVYDLSSNDAEMNTFRKENDLSFTMVTVYAFVLFDVKPSDELYKWIAIDGQNFDYGGFKVVLREDGFANVIYRTAISGDSLDAGELKDALLSVAFTADNHDEELKSRFGGKTVEDARKQ